MAAKCGWCSTPTAIVRQIIPSSIWALLHDNPKRISMPNGWLQELGLFELTYVETGVLPQIS